MSLPPAVVQIKRKRDSDAPPGTLQIESYAEDRQVKRQITAEWVFQRVEEDASKPKTKTKKPQSSANPWENQIPEVKATQPGDELQGRTPTNQGGLEPHRISTPNVNKPVSPLPSLKHANTPTNSPRRFHLTRATKITPRSATAGVHKNRAIATFKERNKISARAIEDFLESKEAGDIQMTLDSPVKVPAEEPVVATFKSSDGLSRPQKKPGKNSSRKLGPAPAVRDDKANSDFNTEKLAEEMQRFALQTIAQDRTNADRAPGLLSSPSRLGEKSDQKFKPKAPAQRYHERHASDLLSKESSGDVGSDTDDDDYVTETYVRVAAHTLEIVPDDMGVLVINNEEELQEFYDYADDSSDNSDIYDDEVDSNAEDNPNNEYPDEELASDDEFDMNAYHYRKNGSDDEEFDFDDANFSDDGNDLPWVES